MSGQVLCKSCGASMTPRQSDGRTMVCEYCGAEVQVAIDAAQIAEGLRLDVGNVDAFLHGLVSRLHVHLADRTRVVREGEQILMFEINLDPDLFVAKRQQSGVVGQHKKLVRGVALRTATHPLDRWVAMLHEALARHANENARVAEALLQLGGRST